MKNTKIPFNKPSLVGKEIPYILDAIKKGQLAGDGFYTHRCSDLIRKNLDVASVLLTSSCTHALELAYLVLGIQPKEEVILPTFTFPSTANAFVIRGAIPRFVDIRPDTLNLDESKLVEALTSRTKAISPVHYAGIACDMEKIMTLAKQKRIPVVEDAAQAMGAQFQGQPLGSFGDVNAFSFHETKNCIAGEGGALLIRDQKHIKKAEIIRQKGTNRSAFIRGEVPFYSWMECGSSYVPSELQAAFLYAQLQKEKEIRQKRKALFDRYQNEFQYLENQGKIRRPHIPKGCQPSYHLFYILMENAAERNRILAWLNEKGIWAVFHYIPLHLSKMGRHFGYRPGDFPVAENLSKRIVRLPLYHTLTLSEQTRIIKEVKKFFTISIR
ncbi:dTDP-4-amino-4,6-dideoxygalactose transaminase [bacterium F11]|nr:dTDP-4-amino-4,6-dideoxygalactose transaminase [bacterium F11]